MGVVVIVELTGPPGAGKSTIATMMQHLLQEWGVHALPAEESGWATLRRMGQRGPLRRAKGWHGMWFALEHPLLAWAVLSAQVGRPIPLRHRYWVLSWFFKTGGLRRFLNRHLAADEAAIFDEGLVQHTVMLLASDRESPSGEAIACYLQRLPPPDLLIALKVPPALCMERLVGRPLPQRVRDIGPEVLSPFVRHAAEAVDSAVGQARRLGWPLVVIDNTAPLAELRAAVRAAVREQLQAHWADCSHTGLTSATVG